MKRSLAREQAFTLIFEKSFREEDSLEDIIADATDGRVMELDSFARNLFSKTYANVTPIDEIISAYSDKWKISRLPKVTLAVLRLALCEINYFDDIPAPVAINEAVELAKKYSTSEDASYINGVLGAYLKNTVTAKE